MAGLPADVKAAARAAAEKEGKPGWKFTLHAPSYIPVMQYAENRDLRARMYRAYVTRAAEFGNTEWDNGPLIEKILALRAEEAALLGFTNYAEVSLAPKMAESPAQVAAFLRDLAFKARPFAERDMAELREFARTELGLEKLESWDLAWAAEKLKLARYAFSDDEVKQYFPEPKVLEGLFGVIQTLFGVQIVPDHTPVWDPAVRFFRIQRERQAGRTVLSRPLCARHQARRRLDGRCHRPPAHDPRACRRRWPISVATFPRRWGTNPPPSATTTC